MTLGEFINYLGDNPFYPVFFFCILPVAALLASIMAKGEGHESPWCIFYSVLIYLSVIPGVFAILLLLFHMLFEKRSIYNMNVMVEILPIVSMILTLSLIKKNVNFSDIPGFGKMTSLLSTVAGIMVIFFFLDKMRIFVFSYLPIHWMLIALVGIFVLIRITTKKAFS